MTILSYDVLYVGQVRALPFLDPYRRERATFLPVYLEIASGRHWPLLVAGELAFGFGRLQSKGRAPSVYTKQHEIMYRPNW